MPPKFKGKFGIPGSHETESQLTSALYRLPEEVSPEKVEDITDTMTKKLAERGLALTDEQKRILHLKITRHFEKTTDFNVASSIDALIETPSFLGNNKGSMSKLLDIHHVKQLQAIAERRKKIAERQNDSEYNPYENMFETSSGTHYLAKLLNEAHLEEESDELTHCVGNSDYYIDRIIKGEIEIFSFRDKGSDNPIFTIEYDRKVHQILQVTGIDDASPVWEDEKELVEAILQLPETIDDEGKPRTIHPRNIEYIRMISILSDKHKRGEAYTREDLIFLYEYDGPTLWINDEEDPEMARLLRLRAPHRQEDISVICDCSLEHIATDFTDINEQTLVYCEDLKNRVTFFDYRKPENQKKLQTHLYLAKKFKETGSPARLDMSFEGGVIGITFDRDRVKNNATAMKSFEEADRGSSPSIWDEWRTVPFTTPEGNFFETIVLSYNQDQNTRQSSKKILEDIDKLGLRPLTFEEMTIAGIYEPKFTKTNSKYFVGLTPYALVSISYVPLLYHSVGERNLNRDGFGSLWNAGYRFLCVRK